MISLKTSNETALRSGMMVMFDDGMMSDGNGGVMFVCGGFFAVVWLCVGLLWNIVWQLVSYGSWFLFFVFPLFSYAR